MHVKAAVKEGHEKKRSDPVGRLLDGTKAIIHGRYTTRKKKVWTRDESVVRWPPGRPVFSVSCKMASEAPTCLQRHAHYRDGHRGQEFRLFSSFRFSFPAASSPGAFPFLPVGNESMIETCHSKEEQLTPKLGFSTSFSDE